MRLAVEPGSECYDVAEAGPAGSTAAKYLAQAGLKVLLIDQRQVIGANVQCAEFVPRALTRYSCLQECDIARASLGLKQLLTAKRQVS